MLIEFKGHKIFAFSDTHGMYRRLAVPADADILICAGDACEGFSPSDMKDFFDWYLSNPAALRIFVAGNHELIFDLEPEYARSLVPEGITFLENSGAEYDGITFHSVAARPWLHAETTLPKGIDFLVTHGPSWGDLDLDTGCKKLYMAIAESRPKYHIFGHVHQEGLKRKAAPGGTAYLNVSYFESLRRGMY